MILGLVALSASFASCTSPKTANQGISCRGWIAEAVSVAQVRESELRTRGMDATVFLAQDVTPSRRREIQTALEDRPEVARIEFESREDAHTRFVELLADEPVIVANTPAKALPESFHVELVHAGDIASLKGSLGPVPGIDQVRDDQIFRSTPESARGVFLVMTQRGFFTDAVGKRVRLPSGCDTAAAYRSLAPRNSSS